jgi:uncharacterized protein (TIGR02118 family)
MVKSIALAYRKPSLTREEYNKYWKEEHAPLAKRLIPGVRRYVQNHLVEIPGMEYKGDGIVEMWYDDVESYQKAMSFIYSEAEKELAADGAKFADMSDGGLWIVKEHVIFDNIK